MLSKNDLIRLFETVLSIPGMNDTVKVSLQVRRKNLLLLNKAIERGLNGKETDEKTVNILDVVPKETRDELLAISSDLLDKGGLVEMNEKLRSF